MTTPVATAKFKIRRLQTSDYAAVYKLFTGSRAVWGTLQLPFPSLEIWRERLAEPPEGSIHLAALAGDELVGQLGIDTFPRNPRRRHAAELGMAVRDDW